MHHLDEDAKTLFAIPTSLPLYSQIRLSSENLLLETQPWYFAGSPVLFPPPLGTACFPLQVNFPLGWLPLAGGCMQPGAGRPAEPSRWVAQTASMSVLWKCVTSCSYSLPEGFCSSSQGPRFPSRVHPLPCQPPWVSVFYWCEGQEKKSWEEIGGEFKVVYKES